MHDRNTLYGQAMTGAEGPRREDYPDRHAYLDAVLGPEPTEAQMAAGRALMASLARAFDGPAWEDPRLTEEDVATLGTMLDHVRMLITGDAAYLVAQEYLRNRHITEGQPTGVEDAKIASVSRVLRQYTLETWGLELVLRAARRALGPA